MRAAEAALKAEESRAAEAPRALTPYDLWDSRGGGSWARNRMDRLRERGKAPVEAEVQAVTVGPLAFVGWPGEIFCELGMAVKRRSPFKPTYASAMPTAVILRAVLVENRWRCWRAEGAAVTATVPQARFAGGAGVAKPRPVSSVSPW
jgi:hypothetical protein